MHLETHKMTTNTTTTALLLSTQYSSLYSHICSGQVEESPDSVLFYSYLPNEPLSKDRVEAFSDGVYAIVATLLILDIWFVPLSLPVHFLFATHLCIE